jgi:hypothetical protein
MVKIDEGTLLICLQSVFESVNRLEALLDSETLRDPENITELLLSYDKAFEVLKGSYEQELVNGANLPPIESILNK